MMRRVRYLCPVLLIVAATELAAASDIVTGNLAQFNDNGAWTWYSDERTIVDPVGGKIIVGADANGSGLGGSPRNGAIESGIFDIKTGTSRRYTMMASGT